MKWEEAFAKGCLCQWARAGNAPAELTLTAPDCPIVAHAENARARIADPETPDELWLDEDGNDRTQTPLGDTPAA